MKYNINQLSSISEINKITIRSWEERHNFLVAERTNTNIRQYSTEQLLCAINVKVLLGESYKISKISKRSYAEINDLVNNIFLDKDSDNKEVYISRIIRSAVLNNRDLFDSTIYNGFNKFGLADFYSSIMFISLQKIGQIWEVHSNDQQHESFVFSLLQEKINDITSEIITNKFSKDIWLLFIMSPYIFLNRDKGHFVSLNNTVKMVADAAGNIGKH